MSEESGGARSSSSRPAAAAAVAQQEDDTMTPDGNQSKRVRLNAIDTESDDEFTGFCAFQAAEAERVQIDWQTDERKCLLRLGLAANRHNAILQTLMAIGDSVHVSEVFCPPRFTAQCHRFGLSAGLAMDLRSGWNFDKAEDRSRA
jgi:hypothetical protein